MGRLLGLHLKVIWPSGIYMLATRLLARRNLAVRSLLLAVQYVYDGHYAYIYSTLLYSGLQVALHRPLVLQLAISWPLVGHMPAVSPLVRHILAIRRPSAFLRAVCSPYAGRKGAMCRPLSLLAYRWLNVGH
jgi:hypothetical protein